MKKKLTLIFLTFLSSLSIIATSGSLIDSRQSSAELFIYKLNRNDLRKLYLQKKNLDESMLHTFVLSCTSEKDIPELPKGNYLTVRAVENKLVYKDHTVDNFYYSIVQDEKVMLLITDTLGNVISDAKVNHGLKFDIDTRTYNTSSINNQKTLEVDNDGVFHYIELENYTNRYRHSFFKRNWNRVKSGYRKIFTTNKTKDKYEGFVVFSKPKYKPGDTVRVKAYINSNGRPYKEEAEVRLKSYYPVKIDTLLTTLSPYRPGMYEWKFKLSDSLRLQLDNNYTISFGTKGRNSNNINGKFRYEEYELGRLTFSAQADKEKYSKSEEVALEFTAKDDNDMPVYDGSIAIKIRANQYKQAKYSLDNFFIPDQIWMHSLDMNGKATDQLVLPDSIFIEGAALHYDVVCTYRDSSNEKQTQRISIYKDMRDRYIDFSAEEGILTIKEIVDGSPISTPVQILAYNSKEQVAYMDSVTLPHSMPLIWIADNYKVSTPTSEGNFRIKEIGNDIMGYRFFRDKGNIRLVVNNPADFPFWYTIREGNRIVDRGYTTQLDYTRRDKGKEGYSMQLSYLLGDIPKNIQRSLPYVEKNISMEVSTPSTVYPGQTSTVEVTVKDKKGRPVKNADITAYAYTSKFGKQTPNVKVFRKYKSGKPFRNKKYNSRKEPLHNTRIPLKMTLWSERMGLDTIEFYKFLYPETIYYHSEKIKDKTTQISPYVVIDGNLQGIHILYIDEQPYYFRQAQQFQVYSFPVTPGFHTLKFRTFDREITAENIYVEEGVKNIVSIEGKNSVVKESNKGRPVRITVNRSDKQTKGILSPEEMKLLSEHLIVIDNTFGMITVPEDQQPFDMPGVINAGGTLHYLNSGSRRIYDYRSNSYPSRPILAGPFPQSGLSSESKNIAKLHIDTSAVYEFDILGGRHYTYLKDSIRSVYWDKPPFSSSIRSFTQKAYFTQNALTEAAIDSIFHESLFKKLENGFGVIYSPNTKQKHDCKLKLTIKYYLDEKQRIKPLMILLTNMEGRIPVQYLYYGDTRDFYNLPEGKYRIDLIFRDSTRHTVPALLQKNGTNHLRINSVQPKASDVISGKAFQLLRYRMKIIRPYNFVPGLTSDNSGIVPAEEVGSFNKSNFASKIITGTVYDEKGKPFPGVTVLVSGTTTGTATDSKGKFHLPDSEGSTLLLSFLGYETFRTSIVPGLDYKIRLIPLAKSTDKVVVTGITTRTTVTGSSSKRMTVAEEEIDLRMYADVAEFQMRGALAGFTEGETVGEIEPQLIILNGIPYEGSLSDIDPEGILSFNLLKGANAAIYGVKAANGVIVITTKGSGVRPYDDGAIYDDPQVPNTLRTNFNDDAFWHPSLSTGADGKVTFEITYPDDITSWNANFIAVGGRKKTDTRQLNIQSFKPINAQLSLPNFAVVGDSLNGVGRMTNYISDSVKVNRTIETDRSSLEEDIRFSNSHTDKIPIIADQHDSIQVTYSLTMESGYFDGERRAIPIYKAGVLESHGEFLVLNNKSSKKLATDPNLGSVTVYADSSPLKLFLDEIDKVDSYPHFCNEQMASKIKVLLSKKKICEMMGTQFKDDKKIRNLISRLEKNKNRDNLWGWWNNDRTELWISKQIVEALQDAESEGYKVNFDRESAIKVLIKDLNDRLYASDPEAELPAGKNSMLDIMLLLKKLDAKIDFEKYFTIISALPDASLNDRLKSIEAMQKLSSTDNTEAEHIIDLATETLMGSLYWGETNDQNNSIVYFPIPAVNNTENTLLAYRIIRESTGHEKELEKIRKYFFEQRRHGSWSNTYESSSIVETILPDLLKEQNSSLSSVLIINGKRYGEFPVTAQFEAGEVIDVENEGTLPIFFTTYQQNWDNKPDSASKGFSIRSDLYQKGRKVTVAEAGLTAELRVKLSVDSDASYVMIEVPIPAGCSYENKNKDSYRIETHREYYKDKVAIFCKNLPKGNHDFTVKLIPRYTGSYHINPAKAELMYYPTFFGREGMKVWEIKASDLETNK